MQKEYIMGTLVMRTDSFWAMDNRGGAWGGVIILLTSNFLSLSIFTAILEVVFTIKTGEI
jgi:hypothetical protein